MVWLFFFFILKDVQLIIVAFLMILCPSVRDACTAFIIGHFRDLACLLFKPSLSAKFLL